MSYPGWKRTGRSTRYSSPIAVEEGGRHALHLKRQGIGRQSLISKAATLLTSSPPTATVTFVPISSSTEAWNNRVGISDDRQEPPYLRLDPSIHHLPDHGTLINTGQVSVSTMTCIGFLS